MSKSKLGLINLIFLPTAVLFFLFMILFMQEIPQLREGLDCDLTDNFDVCWGIPLGAAVLWILYGFSIGWLILEQVELVENEMIFRASVITQSIFGLGIAILQLSEVMATPFSDILAEAAQQILYLILLFFMACANAILLASRLSGN